MNTNALKSRISSEEYLHIGLNGCLTTAIKPGEEY